MSIATTPAATPLFNRVAIIGVGLIGSSLARALREYGVAGSIVAIDRSEDVVRTVRNLGFADLATTDLAAGLEGADLVVLAVPVGGFKALGEAIAPHLRPGMIITDVGSVKEAALRDIGPHLPEGVQFIPGHPVAGTEHSGPEAGFSSLFQGRWCILTPPADADPAAVDKLALMWTLIGSKVEMMDAAHHDRVLAITSHLPHLIAYTIVGTASDLEDDTKSEVIKFSAGGFRDFTRIAASDPVMWRDVFLNNREAVLEILQRFTEDLTALQRAIRREDGQQLQDLFTKTRAIRRGIIDARQA